MIYVRIFGSIVLLFIIYISFYRLIKYKSNLKFKSENGSKYFKLINFAFFIAGLTALAAFLLIFGINQLLHFDDNSNRILAIVMVIGWSSVAFIVVIIEVAVKLKK